MDNGIIVKRKKLPSKEALARFEKKLDELQAQTAAAGLTDEDITASIKAVREKKIVN